MSIEEKVLELIKPSREEYEHLYKAYELIASTIRSILREHGVEAEVTLQGSIAHDTWLSGDRDMDVFVLYPESWSTSELRSRGFNLIVKAAERIGGYELRYAEHPYVRVRVGDVEADIVPAFKLANPSSIRTTVDRTPFHTRFLLEKLTPEMKDQVRLLKKFMKGIKVYGAEVKTRGFSGYVAELLIVKYGSLRRVLEEASSWKPPVRVDTLGVDKEFWRRFEEKYPDSVLYMPDPVDPMRNVAANVSMRALATFILASRCYLSHPSLAFYGLEYSYLSTEKLEEKLRNRCIILLEYTLTEKLPPDVIWGEVNRVRDTLVKFLANMDFHVVDSSSWSDEDRYCAILVELEDCTLPLFKHYAGPPVVFSERAQNFIAKHLRRGVGVWIDERGLLNAVTPRRYVDAIQLLAERASEYSVAPHFKDLKPAVRILDSQVLNELSRRGALQWVSEFIMKTPFWMEMCIS
ncbi:MAG: CCA tRNA nucleotidyltransferase [Desulfurococcus sp.]|nr:CCA tRNA nucleotidyltransferase [Desulfurococcus sp.]